MDRNTITGLVLIFAIFIGFSYWNAPSQEEIEARQRKQDSIAKVQEKIQIQDSLLRLEDHKEKVIEEPAENLISGIQDSSEVQQVLADKYGAFANSAQGENQTLEVENDVMKLDFHSLGGLIYSAELKNYKSYDSLPLVLFHADTAKFGFIFSAANRIINTQDHYFKTYVDNKEFTGQNIEINGDDSVKVSLRLYAGQSNTNNPNQYIEYVYTIYGNKYMFDFNIRMKNMETLIDSRNGYVDFNWALNLRNQEKVVDRFNGSSIHYKFLQDDVDWLSDNKEDQEDLPAKIKWISYKQRFFSMTLIADNAFLNGQVNQFISPSKDPKYEMTMSSVLAIPVNDTRNLDFGMKMYMGPNEFKRLKSYDLQLERQIPIGWSFFLLAWINQYIVINVFDWLGHFGWNYGIVILVLTLLLKLILFPIAYKTYVSSAKMRVLKPEIDQINEKFKGSKDPMKKQQATMDLYKKAGVNPLAGCVPMLLQMPILFAIFRFFPSSIELRQQPFLWAHDLSSYDSIWNLPFHIPAYGDHVSLFTLLMTISTLIYTKVNNDMMGTGSSQMPGMKTMMYIMPIMFLGIFNSYASGLSYYYFLANMITFLQMFLIRRSINEDKIYAKLQANKKKPAKKSGLQARLEKMAKDRGINPSQMKKK